MKNLYLKSPFFLSLPLLLLSTPALSGGTSRPPLNPFEAAKTVDLDSWAKTQNAAILNLILSANVSGKLGPCGCSVDPKGGVDRRYNFVQSQKAAAGTTLILDAGNSLFSNRNIDPSLAAAQRSMAQKIASAQREIGIEVQNVGILDLASGPEFLKQVSKSSGLTFLSSNLVDTSTEANLLFEPVRIKQIEGIGKVLILGLSSLDGEIEGVKSLDPLKVAKEQIGRHQPQLTVVLSDMGHSEDLELMSALSSPVIVVGSRDLNALDIPLHAGRGVLIQPGIQGQQTALLRWSAKGTYSGWTNLSQNEIFSRRWKQLEAELESVRAQKESEGRKASLERIKESFEEIQKYSVEPSDSRAWLYSYELHDMDRNYAQANKLSKTALQD